ncbi:MAG: hypothetical protein INR62_13475 [Rhodospirillales bacterium]|nr:hypothetical protein [Acetobacter sp.]
MVLIKAEPDLSPPVSPACPDTHKDMSHHGLDGWSGTLVRMAGLSDTGMTLRSRLHAIVWLGLHSRRLEQADVQSRGHWSKSVLVRHTGHGLDIRRAEGLAARAALLQKDAA